MKKIIDNLKFFTGFTLFIFFMCIAGQAAIHPMVKDYFVFVPPDYSGKVLALNNSTLTLWDANKSKMSWIWVNYLDENDNELVKSFEGKYIKLTLMYGSTDDEGGYQKHIAKISEQNETRLGTYSKDLTDDRDYKGIWNPFKRQEYGYAFGWKGVLGFAILISGLITFATSRKTGTITQGETDEQN